MEQALIEKSRQAYNLLRTEEDVLNFLKVNKTSIRLLTRTLRSEPATSGHRLQLETRVCALKGLSSKAKHRISKAHYHQHRHTGGGALPSVKENRSDRVEWHELQNAFNRRLRSGMISNLTHKFAEPFLQDAMVLLKRRLINTFRKKRTNIKVYVELSATFTLERTGEIDSKFFLSPTVAITPSTNLEEVMANFTETILTKV